MGGICGEREVSLSTGACVVENLLQAGHRIQPVCIHADGSWETAPAISPGEAMPDGDTWFPGNSSSSLAVTSALVQSGVECVFNSLHGPGGEDGTFQGFLRCVGLPFTGPDVSPAAVTMDKALTKTVLDNLGIRTPRGFPVPYLLPSPAEKEWRELAEEKSREMPFPWIVKPNCLGSSVGIELFHNADEFVAGGVREGSHWCPSAGLSGSGFLVEERLGGRELTCGTLELELGVIQALPPIEILPKGSQFFDYKAKYTPGATEEICPAELDPTVTREVQDLAIRVHRAFQCDPLSRTDMFLTESGELVVLEINTLPGMTKTSLIPQSAHEAGIELPFLFDQLVRHGLQRHAKREAVDSL